MQYGASRAPTNAFGVSRMSRNELLDLYAGAKAVIVQGGPGSILDARQVGVLPIAVPRWPEMQEVVDGHQIAFTETMEIHGEAVLVNSEEQLRLSLEAALQNPELFQKDPRISDPASAAASLAVEIDNMLTGPRHPAPMKKAWRMLRSRRSKLFVIDGAQERNDERFWYPGSTTKRLERWHELQGRLES